MQPLPIDRDGIVSQLRHAGYEAEILGQHLVVHSVPYVDASCQIQSGKLILPINSNGSQILPPADHVMGFQGQAPCDKNGKVITALTHAEQITEIAEGIRIERTFSNKPKEGYRDYIEKVEQYARIICSPATALSPNVTPKTFKSVKNALARTSPLLLPDTNAIRAGISSLNSKLENQKIAIVGLGGTGSYILDLVAKTPVKLIALYDGDVFLQHNAFRSPGCHDSEDLEKMQNKAVYWKSRYALLHGGIEAYDFRVDDSNVHLLNDYDFVFLAVDKAGSRALIHEALIKLGVPFVDSGMGLSFNDFGISGLVRITTVTKLQNSHSDSLVNKDDIEDDVYRKNIQIAELNSMAACFSVIKWKKEIGFYNDFGREFNSTFSIDTLLLTNDAPET